MNKHPTFEHECQYWQQGIELIAGVDEVGIGALAGPVIAAAVVFDRNCKIQSSKFKTQTGYRGIIRDSKQLTAKQREVAAKWIKNNAVAWAAGEASVEEITEINILEASHLAMRRAVESLKVQPNMLLVDGRPISLFENILAVSLVNGDCLSLSIAAASIVAKVYRDELMVKLDKEYPQYGFAAHKGYGSLSHIMALRRFGAAPCHRPTYAPVACLLT